MKKKSCHSIRKLMDENPSASCSINDLWSKMLNKATDRMHHSIYPPKWLRNALMYSLRLS
jgi:hypothetical protein